MAKQLLTFFVFFFSLLFFAQGDLKVTLTGTAETCPKNGSLSWVTEGIKPGASVIYSIYNNAAYNTVIATTSGTSLSGLPSSIYDYRVVATETLINVTRQVTSNSFLIENKKIQLTFKSVLIDNELCGSDGSFEVVVSKGAMPYKYQLLDSNNNVIVEQMTSVFTGLTAGLYKYRVFDACGTGLTGVQQITYIPADFSAVRLDAKQIDCTQIKLRIYNFSGIKYPLDISVKYINPNTGIEETSEKKNVQNLEEGVIMPFFNDKASIVLNITITDSCNRVFTVTKTLFLNINYDTSTDLQVCGAQRFSVYSPSSYENRVATPFKIEFISYPVGFDPNSTDAHEFSHRHEFGKDPLNLLPAGTYIYDIIDSCGRKVRSGAAISKSPFKVYQFGKGNECGADFHSIRLSGQNGYILSETKIITAPQAFIDLKGPLPFVVPEFWYRINRNGEKEFVSLIHLPPGNYEVEVSNSCDGTKVLVPISLSLPVRTPEVFTVNRRCDGSFNISSDVVRFYDRIQKYNPANGQWGNNTTTQGEGSGNFPHYFDTRRDSYYNFGPGRYRIIGEITNHDRLSSNGQYIQDFFCDPESLLEFIIGPPLTFVYAYAFECGNGTYDVSLNATGGTAPFKYSIVDAAGILLKDNGTNPIFEGLPGGIYEFRVTDNCGTVLPLTLDIALLGKPGIRFQPNCETNSLKLSIDNLDYLNFEWYKADNPTTILSTTSVLDLGVYTADKAGDYKVRLSTNSPTSCINTVLDLKLTPQALTGANPGIGQIVNITYNGSNTYLNLFDYLTGVYDGYGEWTEITSPKSSNLLVRNQWLVAAAQSGTYRFRYRVKSPCGTSSNFTDVTINLSKVCYKPAVLTGTIEETKFGITLLGRAGAKNDNWPMVRKGGWMALESNTKGFVLNRVAFNSNNLPIGIHVANFVEGMIVFDTTNQCMKIYNGTVWSCFSTQTCPE